MSTISLPQGINPFDVLGFNKTILGGLSDEQVKRLIELNFRQLSKFHHPDTGGNERVFRLVVAAHEMLEDDAVRAEMLKDHLAPRADKLDAALRQIESLKRAVDVEQDRLIDYIASMARAPYSDVLNPFVPHAATLMCTDAHSLGLDYYFRKNKGLPTEKSLDVALAVQDPELMNSGFVLQILPDGSLARQDLILVSEKVLTEKQAAAWGVKQAVWKYVEKATKKYPVAGAWYTINVSTSDATEQDLARRQRRGVISQNAGFDEAHLDSLFCFRPDVSHELAGWRLIGSLKSTEIYQERSESKTLQQLGSTVKDSSQLADEQQNGYTVKRFRHYLKDMLPVIDEARYLIAARYHEGELRFALVGRVESIVR